MSNLSELLPAGAGAKSASFVASGTLGSGVTVALKADGTVEAVAETNISAAIGTQVNAASVTGEDTAVVYDSATDKFTLFYVDRNNSDYGTYAVGTISGTSITFGTPAVFNSAASTNIDAVYDEASGNIVIVWAQAGTGGRAIVGSRSGNTLTLGSAVTFDSNSTFAMGATYIEDAAKVFIAYQRNGAGTGHGIVGTVSGTSISFGSAATMPSSVNPRRPSTVYIGSSKAVVATRDNAVSPTAGKAVVATISGTSVSFGSFTTFETQSYVATGFQTDVTYDSANDKVVIGYPDGGNSDYGTAIVGTVSGTSISFGTAVVFASTNIRYYYSPTLRYSTKSGKVFTVYVDTSDSNKGKYILGTVSGTSISFASNTTFTTDQISWLSLAVNDITNKFVVGYIDNTTGNYPSAQIIQDAYTTTNSADFVGITDEAISSAASGSVIVQGGVATKASATLPAVLSAGTAAVFEAATTSKVSATFDSNSNKVVIAYQDEGNSNYGTAVIGTVSGTTISYGTPVVFDAGTTSYMGITFDSNSNKAVIAYTDGINIKAIVGTVSGTSISFGTAVQFNTGATNYPISLSFDSTANKVVISYNNQGNSSFGTSIVGTVSGTSISFGTAAVFISAGVGDKSSAYDSTNNKTAIAFINAAGHLAAIVATLSGTSLTFGSVATNSLASEVPCAVFDPVNNKIVIAYKQSVGTASVCTISGTSISLGTPVVFNNNNTGSISGAYNVDKSNIVFVSYQFGATGIAIVGTVSGTSISFGTAATFESGEIGFTSSVYDSVAKKTLAAYQDTANSYYGTATVFTQSAGVLTIASDYYVQTDGSISTTSSTVPAGRALSTTSMLLEG